MTTITHNVSAQKFETTINGTTAYLSYENIDDGTLDYNHTIVPKSLGGQGVGSQLAKFALDYAKESGKKVVPSCSFIADFIHKNPEYSDLIKTA